MVKLTRTAANMYKEACKQAGRNPKKNYLRLYITNNSPGLEITDQEYDDDSIFKSKGVKILVDKISIQWLSDATIDYQETSYGNGFSVDAPSLPTAGSSYCGGCTGDAGCCG